MYINKAVVVSQSLNYEFDNYIVNSDMQQYECKFKLVVRIAAKLIKSMRYFQTAGSNYILALGLVEGLKNVHSVTLKS